MLEYKKFNPNRPVMIFGILIIPEDKQDENGTSCSSRHFAKASRQRRKAWLTWSPWNKRASDYMEWGKLTTTGSSMSLLEPEQYLGAEVFRACCKPLNESGSIPLDFFHDPDLQ